MGGDPNSQQGIYQVLGLKDKAHFVLNASYHVGVYKEGTHGCGLYVGSS